MYGYDDPIGNIDVAGLFGDVIGTTAETAKVLTELVVMPTWALSAVAVTASLACIANSVTSLVIGVANTLEKVYKAFLSRVKAKNAKIGKLELIPGLVARRAQEATSFLCNIWHSFKDTREGIKAWIKQWMPFTK